VFVLQQLIEGGLLLTFAGEASDLNQILNGFNVAKAYGTTTFAAIQPRMECSRCGQKEALLTILSPPPPGGYAFISQSMSSSAVIGWPIALADLILRTRPSAQRPWQSGQSRSASVLGKFLTSASPLMNAGHSQASASQAVIG
jgi:hypothetical protein